ncbi:DUF1573 domain-containing protein [Rubritalea profundi]|uniref:DUF1573 domain-containing protein n=1 Tax=Rubritalea profundi TaxID=1658618 RepID=A0A2S7U434_9BACT|nr:DUF1573 domain-containing protein [Rubritalea profundi]PQJ29786.1 hypothetical protein BSZ32_15725 [Rubritalea profundi]
MKSLITLTSLLLVQLSMAAGELSFKTKDKAVAAAPDAKKIEVLFPFKNESTEEVVVMRYDAPCTCMLAQLKGGTAISKDGPVRFAPGQEGVFKGVFELGNFKGTVDKKIVVWAKGDSEENPSIMLTTKVTIPYLIAAFPQSLLWNVGEELKPKIITIKVDNPEPIKVIKHSCSSPQIDYTLETVKEGFEYKLTITPKSTEKVLFAALRLTTDSENPRYKTVQTFITIKPEKKK